MAQIKKLDKNEFSESRKAAEAEKATLQKAKAAVKSEEKAKEPKAAKMPKAKAVGLTIDQSKLGVTIVLSKEECGKLGFKGASLTSEVRTFTKKKLGL